MTNTERRTIRVAPELWEAAQAVAARNGETVSDIIRRALIEYVSKHVGYVDVTMCGAVGDGVADDTSAINEAFRYGRGDITGRGAERTGTL
jgi:hypothetical protein